MCNECRRNNGASPRFPYPCLPSISLERALCSPYWIRFTEPLRSEDPRGNVCSLLLWRRELTERRQEEPKLWMWINEKGMASPASFVPVWSFAKAGVELWSPSVGWNPQFTEKDRAFCAALWAHGKRRGLSNDEAEALALMRTWAQRCGGHLRYTPAQERRMAAVYTPVAVAVAVVTPTEAS
jgi:hypothetical protein